MRVEMQPTALALQLSGPAGATPALPHTDDASHHSHNSLHLVDQRGEHSKWGVLVLLSPKGPHVVAQLGA